MPWGVGFPLCKWEYIEKHYPFGCSIFMTKTSIGQALGLVG